jgi:hypothetical protein
LVRESSVANWPNTVTDFLEIDLEWNKGYNSVT